MLLSALLFGKPSAAGPDGTGDPDADEPADLGDEAGDVDDDDDDDDDGDDDDDAAAARQSGPSTSVKVLQAGLRSILVAWHLHEAVKHASDVAKWELKQPKMERNLRRNAARMWRAAPDMAGRLAWVNALSRQTRHASIFDEDETEMIKACLAHSISGGFPVDSGSLQELMRTLVVANDIRNGRGKLFGISRTFVRNFCAKNEIDLLRVSPIAKERAEQATPERRDAWFRCVEAYVRRLHAEGKIPWKTWAEVPDSAKYNFDEQAANTLKGRCAGLAPKGHGVRSSRLYELSSDGKMGEHVTDGMTTRADGKVCAPFLIKTAKSAKKDDDALPNMIPSDWENLVDTGAADGETCSIGLGVSKSGSMIKKLFPIFVRHFVTKVLNDPAAVAAREERQGPDGQPVFLFVDGLARV